MKTKAITDNSPLTIPLVLDRANVIRNTEHPIINIAIRDTHILVIASIELALQSVNHFLRYYNMNPVPFDKNRATHNEIKDLNHVMSLCYTPVSNQEIYYFLIIIFIKDSILWGFMPLFLTALTISLIVLSLTGTFAMADTCLIN
ncbi:hypothetical protein D3C76_1019230 [compost metagenome]